MTKTDKELAVELTIDTIDMVTNHKLQNGAPSLNPVSPKEINEFLKSYYSTLKDLKDS
ncbi:hypothetical protein RCF71_04740 [Staphylococcus chromogenes]|uniref:hypothetical protein n=1 Tax=Staphylococcus chromogenes TaxID=46126 RepID=UPI00130080EB|nr:hypothetical protein [Staphylococcus chromogenes]